MIAAAKVPCPECGHANPRSRDDCGLCGVLLRERPAAPAPPALLLRHPPACEPRAATAKVLLVGAVLALVFALLPFLRFMGWFLTALFHETGHCAVAWAAGCPAYPAIRLDGHAVAIHGTQSGLLCVILWVALAWLVWQFRGRGAGAWVLGALALLYPLFAFTGAREFFFLLGGHLGELFFAGFFLQRALAGGWSGARAERLTHAGVGWYLLGGNVWLAGGLLLDEGAQARYRDNGSFGLANDYLRLAARLETSLETIALLMVLVSLAVLPAAWFLSRTGRIGVARPYRR
jgi:hypothetical protein